MLIRSYRGMWTPSGTELKVISVLAKNLAIGPEKL